MADRTRTEAYKAVKRICEGAYSNLVFSSVPLDNIDLAIAKRLALGVIERKYTLDYVLSRYMKKKPNEQIMLLLMTGAYQILYMSKVPNSAAVNETVKIAGELFSDNLKSFVNAVLRNVSREKNLISENIRSAEKYIQYSVNPDLYNMIKGFYKDECDSIFEAFFETQKCFLRVNTLKSNAEDIIKETSGEKISDTAILCKDREKAVSNLSQGKYFIQGLASQNAVKLLDAKENQTVIDVCACPGGKSLGAAIDMNNKGTVLSFDLHRNKLSLIEKSASSLGIDIIKTIESDSRITKRELTDKADRVICDVPCSGIGEIGSKPEIRYKNPDDFSGLYPTQRAILSASSEYLKKGGRLVYSTCSINKNENIEAVKYFLNSEKGKEFYLASEKTYLPTDETNEGFYTAEIIRKE